jgi:hypothetical protein
MDAEKFLLRQLDDLDNLPAVCATLVELIRQKLDFLQHSLGEWEKIHLANAIGALSLNLDAKEQPTTDWLRLCLSHLAKIFSPPAERNEASSDRAKDAEDINYHKLKQATEAVARKLA